MSFRRAVRGNCQSLQGSRPIAWCRSAADGMWFRPPRRSCSSDFSRSDDKEAPPVAGPDRMTTEEVVRKVLLDEHADVLRESLKLLVRELMEVSELIGAELGERRPGDR